MHVDYTWRGTTPSGARRPPSAATVTALDAAAGTSLLPACTIRLVGVRSRGIPDGAWTRRKGRSASGKPWTAVP